MPHSHSSPEEVLLRLRAYLAETVPSADIDEAKTAPGYAPLVLMRARYMIAGFGISNGNISESYESLYRGFKTYYSDKRRELDDLDLAFVFCVQPDLPHLARFCSQIETDVYFCRKFVVPLEEPLAEALACLPFLPLAPIQGRSMRPPSAQTYLRRIGVSASLAKHLVVKGRSPDKIVEDCVSGECGAPGELSSTVSEPVLGVDAIVAPVRLKRVKIENFRAYRKPQNFELGQAVTFLYGPNGFGKTSFFDAVDFAATGGIGRLRSVTNAMFPKTAAHLDCAPDDSQVSLTFESNGLERKVERRVSRRNEALLDGHPVERKVLLSEIARGGHPASDRVDSLVSLFRASHLFSQEHQELSKDFPVNCELPTDIVSRLLAFEDYANGLKKLDGVHDSLSAIARRAEGECADLRKEIESATEDLERLGRISTDAVDAKALNEALHSISQELEGLGVDSAWDGTDLEAMRKWRVDVEVRRAKAQSTIQQLTALAKVAATLPKTVAELSQAQEQIVKGELTLAASLTKRAESRARLRTAEKKVHELTVARKESQSAVERLVWLQTVLPTYASLLAKEAAAQQAADAVAARLTSAQASERTARALVESSENDQTVAASRPAAVQKELVVLDEAGKRADSWMAARVRLLESVEVEKNLALVLTQRHFETHELDERLETANAEVARLARMVADVDHNRSSLRQLVSQLQEHILSGVCPVCGDDHGSVEALQARLRDRPDVDPAEGVRTALIEARNAVQALVNKLNEKAQEAKQTQLRLERLRSEREQLLSETARFEEALASCGIVVTSDGGATLEELNRRRTERQNEIDRLSESVNQSNHKRESAKKALEQARESVAIRMRERDALLRDLAAIQSQLEAIRADPRAYRLDLASSQDDVLSLLATSTQESSALDEQLTLTRATVADAKAICDAVLGEVRALETELASIRSQVVDLEAAVADIRSRFEEAGTPTDTSQDALLALLSRESQMRTKCERLVQALTNLEVSVDAATTAAAFSGLRQGVAAKQRALKLARRRSDQHAPWLEYFGRLRKRLTTQQDNAVSDFVKDYGPRTSVIQRRLRSIYGFDDIEIHSHESAIRVRVRRRGEELRPIDYFSQSQQQTLMLGLFLTTCISQTWSTLSTVLMDDPVTHFDDLNTYAFLDLILGLIESDENHRQFVISTCDEKLLLLARQRFHHLGAGARFYSFSAIDDDGPVVEAVT